VRAKVNLDGMEIKYCGDWWGRHNICSMPETAENTRLTSLRWLFGADCQLSSEVPAGVAHCHQEQQRA